MRSPQWPVQDFLPCVSAIEAREVSVLSWLNIFGPDYPQVDRIRSVAETCAHEVIPLHNGALMFTVAEFPHHAWEAEALRIAELIWPDG